ncbi:MAG: methyltransferase [Bacteroidia bacterium]|nr:methyltransferase [Bacteroidia bacterium]
MLDTFRKKIASVFVKPYLTWYLGKERRTHLKGFDLLIKPSVFHPKYFFSSTYLFDFVNKLELRNKSFLEIGSGSGIISLLAFRKGAHVTSVDINPVAIECTTYNFKVNFKEPHNREFKAIESDIFSALAPGVFDYIAINPPYFFENAELKSQLAWNCGKNGEYFTQLFSQLGRYVSKDSSVYMILADNCDLNRIETIAKQYHYRLKTVEKKKIKWETNFIYSILPQI